MEAKNVRDYIQKFCLYWYLVIILFGPKSLGACSRLSEKHQLSDQLQRKNQEIGHRNLTKQIM